MAYARVRAGIEVTRWDSKWVPFSYRMFWCKQTDERLCGWAQDAIGLLSVLGGVPGDHKMKVGETRRYWATVELSSWQDYFGEWDEDVEFLKVRRAG